MERSGQVHVTQRLFLQDAYLRAFDAQVVDRLQEEGRPALVLDATAFYASAGGQPHDTGTLNSVPVIEVRTLDDGRILHLLAAAVADDAVHGELDWERRFDHMQQHTGQHILSQAFLLSARASTVGFHLGESDATIDLDVAPLTGEQIAASEMLANRVVIENRQVIARFVSEQELAAMPLRKPPAVDGPLRIVHVEGFDWSPCGGTHVRASGEVGPIKVTRIERRRDVTRVHFVCGWRALRDYGRKHQNVQALALRLTTSEDGICLSVERLEAKNKELQKALNDRQLELLQYQVPDWISRAEFVNGIRVVRLVFDDGDVVWLKEIARRLTQQPTVVALLATRNPAPQFIFARSEDIALDVASLMRASCAVVGGRGGGRPMLAQGGAPEGASADIAVHQAMIELERS